MNPFLRLVLTIGTLLFFVFVAYMVRKKRLSLKYTLTWLGASLVLICLAVFDGLIVPFANMLQVREPVNALFLAVFFFVLLILFTLTVTISNNSDNIRALTQELALIKKELEEKEKL